MRGNGSVHILDGDEPLHLALKRLLRSVGCSSISYPTTEAVTDADLDLSGCLLLDFRISRMDRLEAQARHIAVGANIPVIIVTAHGEDEDVPLAVQAMKAGTFDVIERPADEDGLFDEIDAALSTEKRGTRDNVVARAAERAASLSPRERQVLEGIVAGKANKAIAADLDISVRTVEVHRTRLMARLGIHSIAEAIGIAVVASLNVLPC